MVHFKLLEDKLGEWLLDNILIELLLLLLLHDMQLRLELCRLSELHDLLREEDREKEGLLEGMLELL